jgi:uncharacterized Zn finger protein
VAPLKNCVMSSSSPEGLLDRPLLRQLAGPEVFAKGEKYFAAGCVRQVHAGLDRVTARVNGSRPYRVKLWRGRGELQFACNCAVGREDAFCKHCVAVGLAWLAGPDGQPLGPGSSSVSTRSSTAEAPLREEGDPPRTLLRDYLRTLEKDRLVSLMLEATDYDDILRRRLLLETIGLSRPGSRRHVSAAPIVGAGPDLEAYRQILHEAIECGDYVDYDSMPDYTQSVEEAVRPLGELLRQGQAAAVVELAEFALIELDRASEMLDGGDGSLNAVYDDLQHFHLQACLAARPNPEALAHRLLAYELEGGLGVFNNAVRTYAEVLGPPGLAAWRELLLRAWGDLRVISPLSAENPGSGRPPIDHRRFQVMALMERLAEATGDWKLLELVRRSDLSSVHDYLSLAEFYETSGQPAQAVDCAEEGMRKFPDLGVNSSLRDFLAHAYGQLGRHEDAAALAWEEFAAFGSPEYYEKLKEHARHTGKLERWRKRALTHLRSRIAADRKAAKALKAGGTADYSPIVEILLADGRDEAAWDEANAHGCRPDLWMRLALQRQKNHPADALRIYQEQLGPTIAAGGHNAYREAVDLVSRIGTLLERLGRAAEFVPYRAGIRAAHRQKRTFLKLLDASDR